MRLENYVFPWLEKRDYEGSKSLLYYFLWLWNIVRGERENKFNMQPVMHHTDTDFSYHFNNTGISLTPPGEKTWHLTNMVK